MSSQKIAFITGGNRGIGFETAKQLGSKKVKVVIGARNLEKGKKAVQQLAEQGIEAQVIKFDAANPQDHQAAYDYFEKNFGRLDILINNAGVFIDTNGPLEVANTLTLPLETLRSTYEANFFGPFALTQKLIPLLKKSDAGRIVNLSSILGSLGLHADATSPIYEMKHFAYDSSKTALNALTINLAYELRNTKIKINSAHPGWVKTDMGGEAAPMEITDGAKTSVRLALLPEDGPTGGFFHMDETLPW